MKLHNIARATALATAALAIAPASHAGLPGSRWCGIIWAPGNFLVESSWSAIYDSDHGAPTCDQMSNGEWSYALTTGVFRGYGEEQLIHGPRMRMLTEANHQLFNGNFTLPRWRDLTSYQTVRFINGAKLVFSGFDAVLGAPSAFGPPFDLSLDGDAINNLEWLVASDNHLRVDSGRKWTFTNQGTFAKTAGAGTTIVEPDFINAGHVRAASGRLVFTGSVKASSGSFIAASGAAIELGQGAEFGPNARVQFNGRFINNGRFVLTGIGPYQQAEILLTGSTTFEGKGTIELGKSGANYLVGKAGASSLTIGVGQTLSGTGLVGTSYSGQSNDTRLSLTNQGTIRADAIAIYHNSFINQGTIKIDGTLGLNGPFVQNQRGTIVAKDGATLNIVSGGVNGGSVRGGNAAPAYLKGGGSFADLTMEGLWAIQQVESFNLKGSIVNNGTLSLERGAIYRPSNLTIDGATSLTGKGQLALGGTSYVYGSKSGSALLIGPEQTLSGSGIIGASYGGSDATTRLALTNQGTIRADALGIHHNSLINDGAIKIDGTLGLNGPFVQNQRGTMAAKEGATLNIASGGVAGGSVHGGNAAPAYLKGGGTFADLTMDGLWAVQQIDSFNLKGSIVNKGTLTLERGAIYRPSNLTIDGATSLTGNGALVLGGTSYVYGSKSGSALLIGRDQTLSGSGIIGASYGGSDATTRLALINQGTLATDTGSSLSIYSPANAFTTAGTVLVRDRSTLSLTGADYRQQGSLAHTIVDGTLVSQAVHIDGGLLSGNGTIKGNVLIGDGSSLGVGSSPGHLSISGDFDMATGSTMVVDIAGPTAGIDFDLLRVSGKAKLNGTLRLNFSYAPKATDSFAFIAAGGGVVGSFSNTVGLPSGWTMSLDYQTGKVVISNVTAVPEPSTYLLFSTGLLALPLLRRRVRAERTSTRSHA